MSELDAGHRCLDCGARPPATDTNYTLISTRYGWRCTRAVDVQGRKTMVWRCPPCWLKHRTQKVAAGIKR
jgi:hypothetical protein